MKVVKATDQSKVLAMAAFFFFDSSLALGSLAWSNWSSRKFSGRRSAKSTNLLALMAWTRWAGTGGSPERGRIRSSTAELEGSGATAVGVTAGGLSGGGGAASGSPNEGTAADPRLGSWAREGGSHAGATGSRPDRDPAERGGADRTRGRVRNTVTETGW